MPQRAWLSEDSCGFGGLSLGQPSPQNLGQQSYAANALLAELPLWPQTNFLAFDNGFLHF